MAAPLPRGRASAAAAASLQPEPAPTWWSTISYIGGAALNATVTVGSVVGSAVIAGASAAASAAAAAAVSHSAGTPATSAAATPSVSTAGSAASAVRSSSADSSDVVQRAERLREEARALMAVCTQQWQESQDRHKAGDGAGARAASERRIATQARIDSLRAQAAAMLFAHYNAGRGLNEIDLHGLYVEEALAQMTRRIEACNERLRRPQASLPAVHSLVVIVGRGNHSRDKIARLKPEVTRLIQMHKLRVQADVPNPGCLTVEFGSNEPSGWIGQVTDACAIM